MVGLLGLAWVKCSHFFWANLKVHCEGAMTCKNSLRRNRNIRKGKQQELQSTSQPSCMSEKYELWKAGSDRWAKYLEDLVVDQGRWLYIVVAELVCNEAFGGCDHSIRPGRGSKLAIPKLGPLIQKVSCDAMVPSTSSCHPDIPDLSPAWCCEWSEPAWKDPPSPVQATITTSLHRANADLFGEGPHPHAPLLKKQELLDSAISSCSSVLVATWHVNGLWCLRLVPGIPPILSSRSRKLKQTDLGVS